jgi:hypothetical protein
MSATTADFVEVHKEFVLPVSTQPWALGYISLVVGGMNFGSAGDAFRIDDFQAWAEVADPRTLYLRDARMQEVSAYPLVLEDPASPFGTGGSSAAVLRFLAGTPAAEGSVLVERRNKGAGLDPALDLQGRLINLGAGLLATTADQLKPRIQGAIATGAVFQLLQEWTGSSGSIRIYGNFLGRFYLTSNARLDTGGLWNRDDPAMRSTRFSTDAFFASRLVMAQSEVAVGNPFNEGQWTTFCEIQGAEPTTVANPKFEPIIELKDAGGNRRVLVDHLGLPAGRIVRIAQNWMQDVAADPEGWFKTTGGGGAVNYQQDTAVLASYCVEVQTLTAGDFARSATTNKVAFPNAAKVHVLEWEAYFNQNATDTGMQILMGFISLIAPLSQAVFAKISGSNFWQINHRNNAGPPTTVALGSSPANGTRDRFRIEIHGSSMPGGARVLWYLNGVLVHEATTNLPDNTMGFTFQADRIAGGPSTTELRIGPVYYTTNRVQSDDAL